MDEITTKKRTKISTKITISIIIFVIATLVISFSFSFLNIKKIMRDDLKLRLLNMVSIAEIHVDVEKHSLLKNNLDEDTQNYKDIKKELQDIRNKSTDITYIYTLRENEKKEITFIVDAEENPDKVSHLGDVYADPNQFLKDNFLTINKPIVEDDFSTDEWGTWISGFAPIYDKDGKRDGVLGIDISVKDVIDHENQLLIYFWLLMIVSGAISLILGIIFSKKIMQSLSSLTSILSNNTDKKIVDIPISDDEIGDLTNIIKTKINKANIKQEESDKSIEDKNASLKRMNDLMVGRELEMIKLKEEIADLKNNSNK